MASPTVTPSRQLLQPLSLYIESDYGDMQALAWWLSGGEIRFSCKGRVLPGQPRTIQVRLPGERPIPLQVMVRKASTMPSQGDNSTFLHKGTYRLLHGSDEPRLRRARKQGDPANPVKAPTITGSVTPKRRRKSKTLPTGKALREAVARGRCGTTGEGWWAPHGVPAILDTAPHASVYVDLSIPGHLERCVDQRTETLRLHLTSLSELQEGAPLDLVLQLPDHSFPQLKALVVAHHSHGTVIETPDPGILESLLSEKKREARA